MRPDQFTHQYREILLCARCCDPIDGTYYKPNHWVSGDPEWAHVFCNLCEPCWREALAAPTTSEGAEFLARSDDEELSRLDEQAAEIEARRPTISHRPAGS